MNTLGKMLLGAMVSRKLAVAAGLALLAGVLFAAPLIGGAQESSPCDEMISPMAIVGTGEDDDLEGTDGDDIIFGLGGDET